MTATTPQAARQNAIDAQADFPAAARITFDCGPLGRFAVERTTVCTWAIRRADRDCATLAILEHDAFDDVYTAEQPAAGRYLGSWPRSRFAFELAAVAAIKAAAAAAAGVPKWLSVGEIAAAKTF